MTSVNILLTGEHSEITPYIISSLEKEGYLVTYFKEEGLEQKLKTKKWMLAIIHTHSDTQTASLQKTLAQQCPTLPTIILSAKKHSGESLLIPFPFQDLIAKVKELLAKDEISSGIFHLDNLTVDLSSKTAVRSNKTLILTKKEFSLLSYLMQRKNTAVSRADLIEQVWGMQIDPLSNTVEAHILSLRHKVDTAGQEKLIHTIPKFGYKMSISK